jgi:predicted nucleic acid-binding Zn ribbon protein
VEERTFIRPNRSPGASASEAGKPSDLKRGLESIGKILDRWLRTHQVERRLDPESVYQRWKDVVGESIAARTKVIDVIGGLLIVEVDSAALLHELSTYYRHQILESLRRLPGSPNLRDIRFRAGSTEGKR